MFINALSGVRRCLNVQLGERVSDKGKSQRERNHNFNLHLNFTIFIKKLVKIESSGC